MRLGSIGSDMSYHWSKVCEAQKGIDYEQKLIKIKAYSNPIIFWTWIYEPAYAFCRQNKKLTKRLLSYL